MQRLCRLLALLTAWSSHAAEPLTTRTDDVGRALNQWFAEGTAAGFAALQYENRDNGHSLLPANTYPSLRSFHVSEEDKKRDNGIGVASTLRPTPTIGNASMAAPPDNLGSIPRMIVMARGGSEFLFKQYLSNNLFVYPEHLDYDAGANGVGGWGDLYTANTPCLIISQGSSHSDMPFVKALLAATAAMQPGVQQLLMRQRILCPTLQALFRQNSKLVDKEEDYFTGKAHPPVFDASTLDEMKLVSAAQLLSPDSIPPLAFMEVLSESPSQNGREYFESSELSSEAIATTPSFVARAFRSSAEEHELRLSARRSLDTQKRPLSFRWVLLQGDPKLVSIQPNETGEEATIKVRWHPPLQSTSGIRSHRVDIGLFALSPLAASAPAILSFAMLPNELRFFDTQGRLNEICYEAGNPELGLPNSDNDPRWLAFFRTAAVADDTVIFEQLSKRLSPAQRQAFTDAWLSMKPLQQSLEQAQNDPARKDEASKLSTERDQAIVKVLAKTVPNREGAPIPLRSAATSAIQAMANDPTLFLTEQAGILTGRSPPSGLTDLRSELKRWKDLGVLVEDSKGQFRLACSATTLSDADRCYLRLLNLTVLSQVLLPGFLQRSPAPLYVDPRLGAPKAWRDLYHYDEQGKRTGWTRHSQGRTWLFDTTGQVQLNDHTTVPAQYRLGDGHLRFELPAK